MNHAEGYAPWCFHYESALHLIKITTRMVHSHLVYAHVSSFQSWVRSLILSMILCSKNLLLEPSTHDRLDLALFVYFRI